MVLTIFNSILDPIFSPLLVLEPLLSLVIISFLIALLTTLAYKKFTDQSLMKDLKDEIKTLQKQMKELKDKPDKMLKVQKKVMDTNMKYMMHSLKPMFFTFIPIILIFGWLHSHMAYYPIVEDQEFTVTIFFEENYDDLVSLEKLPNDVFLVKGDLNQKIADYNTEWVLTGKQGDYNLKFNFKDEIFEKIIKIAKDEKKREYASPVISQKDNQMFSEFGIERVEVNNQRVRPLKDAPFVGGILGSIPWVGNFGWLGTYILLSIFFSITLRKLLKVY
ncbi:MAG: EMC3/TMCO1 family protein [Candidatus Woesearchaeota archaeon]